MIHYCQQNFVQVKVFTEATIWSKFLKKQIYIIKELYIYTSE